MKPGPRNLITDVPGLIVGNAADPLLKSGTTVLTSGHAFTASVAVMGGAPGTRETDLLAPDKLAPSVDALVLSGGSAFGLAAAEGVMSRLRATGRGFLAAGHHVPLVPAAILFDLANGGDKSWNENPYHALGAQAFDNAAADFQLGSAGAGSGALAANCKGGLGSASFVLESGITVGALVAVNPIGSVTAPGDRHFWAAPFEIDAEFGGLGPCTTAGLGTNLDSRKARAMQVGTGTNTTIAIVATDAALDKAQCQRMATAAHDGIARAIVPAHTPMDGDLVFAAATGDRPLTLPPAEMLMIGHAAGLCLARAIARACFHAKPAPGDLIPCWSDLNA